MREGIVLPGISHLKNKRKGRAGRSAGFTLIELAIALTIVGIMTGSGFLMINKYITGERVKETRRKMDFVMNVMSSYVQTHYRLPCPADPGAAAGAIGQEGNNGQCLNTSSDTNLYMATEGIVPWKELGIPQDMVVDGWGRYLTYKPAPNLTINMQAAQMQKSTSATTGTPIGSTDVHNACRTSMWFDSSGRHVNRAKALFCCNSDPKANFLATVGQGPMPATWRNAGVVTTDDVIAPSANGLDPATSVHMTNAWSDSNSNIAYNGDFSSAHYKEQYQDEPLLRATGPALTLISHGADGAMAFIPEKNKTSRNGGGNVAADGTPTGAGSTPEKMNAGWPQMFLAAFGHPKANTGTYDLLHGGTQASDDVVAYLRTDQIFGKVGGGSCESPPAVAALPYTCSPQKFADPSTPAPGNNPTTAQYGYLLQLALTGNKYQLRTSFTQKNASSGYDNSLGFYVVGSDGTIKNVSLVVPSVRAVGENNTSYFSSSLDPTAGSQSVGIFIISNGNGDNNYSQLDMDHMSFVNPNGNPAKITDTTPPILYAGQGATRQPIHNEGVAHLASNLNPGRSNHQLRPEHICQHVGDIVGANHDYYCAEPALIDYIGVSPDKSSVQIAFEDLANVVGYETTTGFVAGTNIPSNAIDDGYGGYVARIGDDDYNDVAFNFSMTACPLGP